MLKLSEKFQNRKLLWLVGGCSLLLCATTFALNRYGAYPGDSNPEAPSLSKQIGTATSKPSILSETSILLASPTPRLTPSSTPVNIDSRPTATSLPVSTDTPSPENTPEPQFNPICFRPVGEDGDLLACDTTFSGATQEVHVIFDYAHMAPGTYEWTRIWYLNGQEVLKVKEPWTGDVTGQFDYSLNTSDGQPLASGNWELELYIENDLKAYGGFIVETPTSVALNTSPNTANATPAPITNSTYRLAFTKWDGGKHAIWVANLDGSNQQFLLDFAASPSWNPHDYSLAFYGQEGIDTQDAVEGGTNGIWTMGPNGENPTRIVPEGTGQSVTWSPTGDAISFDAARGGPDRRIYFVDEGGNPLPYETLGSQPSFSPDGQTVVAKVCRPECGLWLSARSGAGATQLTSDGSDGLPAWSPLGQQIAFSRNVDGNVDIYLIDIDGTNLQRLTTAPNNDSVPTWTPDGQQLAFRSTRNGLWQIFIMSADGSNQRMIIDQVGASDEWAFDKMSIK